MLIRVADSGGPAFHLRKGEEGLSVFDSELVDPPLTEPEVLDAFRTGSVAICLSSTAVEQRGLRIVPVEGASVLPERLRLAHAEIRPGMGMNRARFKQALKELESDVA